MASSCSSLPFFEGFISNRAGSDPDCSCPLIIYTHSSDVIPVTASKSPGYCEQTRASQRLPLTYLETVGDGGPWVGSISSPTPFFQWFQFVEVPGNHYTHMNKPQTVAAVISSFLQGLPRTTSSRL